MLLVAAEGNRPVRRRYAIRQLDTAARLLTPDIELHGDGPGEHWARPARSGDGIEAMGPRGKITTSATADWHLFTGPRRRGSLRREAGDREALKRIRSDSGEGRTFTREELAEAWGISE